GSSVCGESRQVSQERRPSGRTTAPPPTRSTSRRTDGSKTSPRPSRRGAQKNGGAKKDRSRRSSPKQSEEKDLPISTDDDEENEPLAKRMCRLYNQRVDQQKPSADPPEGNLNKDNAAQATPVSSLPDAGTPSVTNPNFLSNRDPESEQIWQYFEQLQNTRPLQTVMPASPSCKTPSPPRQKLDEDDEERLRRWAANRSSEQNQVMAAYEGKQHLSLSVSIVIGGCMPLRYIRKGCGYWIVYIQENLIMKDSKYMLMRWNCGVFVIKFMQFWVLDKPLQHWDKDVAQEFRNEIILDIVLGPHNSQIGMALQALDSAPVRRNQPRKKTKAVKSPITAPSTRSMLQRAGLPTRKPAKGGRQRKKTNA
ncbi:hypothetical protein HN51_011579, partial [Arachis hypogaea]